MRLHTSLDIYMPKGEVSETVMLGETSDISNFFEHELYDWVMFRDKPIQQPDENTVLGRYLGPEIAVGPEMTANTMKENGEVVHFLEYRGLKED